MTAYIGYNNVLESATVTASSEATASGTQTFVVENAYDWLQHDYWKPSSAGNATLSAAFSLDTTVDYVAAWGNQSGTRYQLEYSTDGVTWSALSGVKTLDGASFDKFTSTTVPSGVTENLLLYSDQFDNAAWNKINTTVTADALSNGADLLEATADGNDFVTQVYTTTSHANRTYTFSVFLKNDDLTGNIVLRLRDGGGGEIAAKSISLTSSFERYSITGTFGASPANNIVVIIDPVEYTGNAGKGYYAMNAQLKEGQLAPYSRTTSATFSGTVPTARLRLYPKQNLLTYSEEFENAAWTDPVGQFSVSANATAAPDGTMTADVITIDTGHTRALIRQLITKPSSKWSGAVWAKLISGTATSIIIDVSDGGATSNSLVLGEWVQAKAENKQAGEGSGFFDIELRGAEGTQVALWGAQLEEAPSVGEYQKTTSAAAEGTIQLPMVSFGESLELGGIRPGFAPPGTISHGESVNSISEDGRFLGRTTRDKGQSLTIQQTVVAPAWVRSNLPAFSAHALQKPYFFAWDDANYPSECALIVPPEDGGISAPEYESPLYMRFTIKGEAWT